MKKSYMGFAADDETRVALEQFARDLYLPEEDVIDGDTDTAVDVLSNVPTPECIFVDLGLSLSPLVELDKLAGVCDPGTQVIAMGTVNDISVFRDMLDAGVADYLLKPVTPDRLKQAYEKAIRAAPHDFDIQNTYAVFLCRHQNYSEAQVYFDKAGSHPENDDAEVTLTNAGVCMGQKPDLAAAEKYFRMALDHRSSYSEALLQLCLLKFQQDDYLGARAFLQRYMSSAIPTAGVLYLASRIEDMLGNDRGKTEYEDQLIREFPTSPEARTVLGAG